MGETRFDKCSLGIIRLGERLKASSHPGHGWQNNRSKHGKRAAIITIAALLCQARDYETSFIRKGFQ